MDNGLPTWQTYAVQNVIPGFSTFHVMLAAALTKLGRIEKAEAAGTRLLGLQPAFRYGHFISGVNCIPELAASLSEALCNAGLPE